MVARRPLSAREVAAVRVGAAIEQTLLDLLGIEGELRGLAANPDRPAPVTLRRIADRAGQARDKMRAALADR